MHSVTEKKGVNKQTKRKVEVQEIGSATLKNKTKQNKKLIWMKIKGDPGTPSVLQYRRLLPHQNRF